MNGATGASRLEKRVSRQSDSTMRSGGAVAHAHMEHATSQRRLAKRDGLEDPEMRVAESKLPARERGQESMAARVPLTRLSRPSMVLFILPAQALAEAVRGLAVRATPGSTLATGEERNCGAKAGSQRR